MVAWRTNASFWPGCTACPRDDRRRATSDRATLGGMTTATEPSGSAGSARSTGAGLHQHGRRAAPLASVLLFLDTGCQGTLLGIPMGDRLR